MAVADVPGLMDIARYVVLACRSKIRDDANDSAVP